MRYRPDRWYGPVHNPHTGTLATLTASEKTVQGARLRFPTKSSLVRANQRLYVMRSLAVTVSGQQ
jgi:hypothetical protein